MEAVIFAGIQGSGKSTFFQKRFASTHTRINLDTLKTRQREMRVLQECLQEGKDFVVDNTNPTPEERSRYLEPARAAGYILKGFFFDVPIADCIERNKAREGKSRIPIPGLYATRKKMKPPSYDEGFHELFLVAAAGKEFAVTPLPRGSSGDRRPL